MTSEVSPPSGTTVGVAVLVACVLLPALAFAVDSTGISDGITRIDEDLTIEPLADGVWVHTSYAELPNFGRVPGNGLVIVSEGRAALIDTPWSDELTARLADWVKKTLGADLVATVATHSHDDCAGGFAEAARRGARTITGDRTARLLETSGRPAPHEIFADRLEFRVGKIAVELRFVGSGHTEDTIVAWLPKQRVLFGGCLVKLGSSKGLGYTAEAVMEDWPLTLQKIRREFAQAKRVVPGHGGPGGIELVEHTLALLRSAVVPDARYVFYLHGRIVEDMGREAVSPRFGAYLYDDIVHALASDGRQVISEVRPRGCDVSEYAQKVAAQIRFLRSAGVPAINITVVGASKGAGIAVLVSHELAEPGLRYVLLGTCSSGSVREMKSRDICITGHVLAIRDRSDELAGSCRALEDECRERGLSSLAERVVELGNGHGLLYRPYPEWVTPTLQWSEGAAP